MTSWIMEDEEELLDMLELYEEARNFVDLTVPRRGDNQTEWIFSKGPDFIQNWLYAHFVMSRLKRELE